MGASLTVPGVVTIADNGNNLTGVESIPRTSSYADTAFAASGALTLTYFTAYQTVTVTKIGSHCSYTAAGATPTLCRMGLYLIDSNGNGTLVASCVNTTTMWSATDTTYLEPLASPSSYQLQTGQRYAGGLLVVTTAVLPKIMGAGYPGTGAYDDAPRLAGSVSGNTDLPATFTAGSVTSTLGNNPRVWLTP